MRNDGSHSLAAIYSCVAAVARQRVKRSLSGMFILDMVLVLKDSLSTNFKSLSLSLWPSLRKVLIFGS